MATLQNTTRSRSRSNSSRRLRRLRQPHILEKFIPSRHPRAPLQVRQRRANRNMGLALRRAPRMTDRRPIVSRSVHRRNPPWHIRIHRYSEWRVTSLEISKNIPLAPVKQ